MQPVCLPGERAYGCNSLALETWKLCSSQGCSNP